MKFEHVLPPMMKEFVEFWLDVIREWEEASGRRVNVALGATKP